MTVHVPPPTLRRTMNVLTRFRPSPAMVIACIALTVALGGTSVAAINALPRNSVGTKQLKKNAVTGPKIKASAVTGVKVANNSLTGADVNEASLGQVPSAASAGTRQPRPAPLAATSPAAPTRTRPLRQASSLPRSSGRSPRLGSRRQPASRFPVTRRSRRWRGTGRSTTSAECSTRRRPTDSSRQSPASTRSMQESDGLGT